MRDFQMPGRSAAYGENGMVATSHPLATLAGLDVLKAGGSAADAAIAAAAMLAVVEQQNAGIGGDTFWMVGRADGSVSAYNGSGRMPAATDPDKLAAAGGVGLDSIHSVTVPGAVDAMCRLHVAHARLPLDRLLMPAIRAAEKGYIVLPRVARDWAASRARLAASPTAAPVFVPGGRVPEVGDRFADPALGRTLRAIAEDGAAGFYEGPVAESMVKTLRALGGVHTLDDFADHSGTDVTPISTSYRGREILECPPNGQGIIVLILLNILSGFDIAKEVADPVGFIHLMAEASKLAYAERNALLADPAFAEVPVERLLSDAHADLLRAQIDRSRAQPAPRPFANPHRDTVYLTVVDRTRTVVSFINSIFTDYGSAHYDAGSGVLFHNRGASFSMEPGHPNSVAPGKRPMHTIIPGLMRENGTPTMGFGVMGGHYQAMGQAHFLMNLLDLGLDPQEALSVPRSFGYGAGLQLETAVPEAMAAQLAAMGHVIERAVAPMGGGQAIRIDPRGVLIGGSDPRKDGCALGF